MDTKLIYEAIYNMVILANTRLNKKDYNLIKNSPHQNKDYILKNAYLAYKNNRPLCQDTGQVVVFISVGQDIKLEGEFIEDVINKAVEDSYRDNYYRKSVVFDSVYNRENTKTNTPSVIHTKFQKGSEINILVGIKGGGAENMTKLKMMNPTSSFDEIKEFIKETVIEAGENACPPMIVGVGAGGCAETAAINAKYALFKGKKLDIKFDGVLETRIVTSQTHIASLPVCINLNCHSIRHIECKIINNEIKYNFEDMIPKDIEIVEDAKKINTKEVDKIKHLKKGEKILLSGKIYTLRDMGHKRLTEIIEKNEVLPFEIENSIIFYAGPCPKNKDEIIGPIGPTTSKRMDKYAPLLYKKGVLATIGKGDRTVKGTGWIYFKGIGGISNIYKQCVKSAKVVCFEDLGSEAMYELEVENMPLSVDII